MRMYRSSLGVDRRRGLSAWTLWSPVACHGGPRRGPPSGTGLTCAGPAGGGGNIGGPAGALPGSSATGAAGGREPPALVLPRWAAPRGSASVAGGGAVPGSRCVHPPQMVGRAGDGTLPW